MAGLDFEKPIVELEKKIQELKSFMTEKKIDLSAEIKKLDDKLGHLKKDTYINLSAWQKVQLARHPLRPYTLDYISMIMSDFVQLHGDRLFSDDKAMVCGLAKLDKKKVMVIGHQKGRDTKENLKRNFGCAHPEGYRKALRLMQMAEEFDLPIVVFIDTPGAYPGIGAEERGQSHAIALNLREMISLTVPIVAIVIGEGGSGGALGVGVADRVAVLENSYYSVISPEGCAAILWKDGAKAPLAAEVLKLTGPDLLKMGLIDEMIPEPLGGAHRDVQKIAASVKETILRNLKELGSLDKEELLKLRYKKFRSMGVTG
ncbi:MAG: acetyl-CoA carboxylase carboxyltransferase subunit alpha [Candidatus Omnitrophica bacterium]|nr:acetyl-CoA carboxylase carboxyltransferase subunit alpha [Candidatus Omnitrophota bacterium]MBU4302797.1 acetyl-CoA carboxylase carboxyltransferase subunit alpha [Candidatus Omnitrophota bacterium]MBU4418856.1 acetyl-CoA carboxylase carboxyltransferase subunit alpha [Candidatus Omnitrophota bacterium]MBU4468678.1 acetyl-CoA carboxylase carboxyltransferase subunit alpha [Candidatus Omnitrophota bacterium]MCG2708222.1 acetyl-CoA carboxylase carboxyltransferase subunit alpha [Candidatus Omnitro